MSKGKSKGKSPYKHSKLPPDLFPEIQKLRTQKSMTVPQIRDWLEAEKGIVVHSNTVDRFIKKHGPEYDDIRKEIYRAKINESALKDMEILDESVSMLLTLRGKAYKVGDIQVLRGLTKDLKDHVQLRVAIGSGAEKDSAADSKASQLEDDLLALIEKHELQELKKDE